MSLRVWLQASLCPRVGAVGLEHCARDEKTLYLLRPCPARGATCMSGLYTHYSVKGISFRSLGKERSRGLSLISVVL